MKKAIKRGARQGCVMFLDIFLVYSKMILKSIKEIKNIKVSGVHTYTIRFTDG